MNCLFRFLASCILSVIVALFSIVSPALAQSSGQVQIVKNLDAILSKGYTYYIASTPEGSTVVQFQNHSDDFEAKVAFLLSKKDGKQIKEIVRLPPNYLKGVEKKYSSGSRATVQNVSDSDPKVTFLLVSSEFSNNPTSVEDNFNIAIDDNTTVDKIIDQLKYSKSFVIQIVNNTPYTLYRVGAYNDSSNWPLGNIEPLRVVGQQFSGNSFSDTFSFASNYKIGDTGKFVQFSASWPLVGVRKINLGVINESGNAPAKKAWDNMYDPNDKSFKNGSFNVRAFMTQKNGSVIWSYEVM